LQRLYHCIYSWFLPELYQQSINRERKFVVFVLFVVFSCQEGGCLKRGMLSIQAYGGNRRVWDMIVRRTYSVLSATVTDGLSFPASGQGELSWQPSLAGLRLTRRHRTWLSAASAQSEDAISDASWSGCCGGRTVAAQRRVVRILSSKYSREWGNCQSWDGQDWNHE
jgi:hypothetical protein